jgi:hypothetical protein
VEHFCVSEILTLAHHFNKQLLTSNVNDKCKRVFCNEWYELKVLREGKTLNELLI